MVSAVSLILLIGFLRELSVWRYAYEDYNSDLLQIDVSLMLYVKANL